MSDRLSTRLNQAQGGGRVGATTECEPPGARSRKRTETYHRLEAHSDQRQEQGVRSTSNKHTASIQFTIVPRHEIKENVEIKFFQVHPLPLPWVSQHVCVDLDQQPNKTGRVFFGRAPVLPAFLFILARTHTGQLKFVFIQKSGVLVIIGLGKLTDALKIKHTIICFLLLQGSIKRLQLY